MSNNWLLEPWKAVSDVLRKLLESDALMAYQIGFELYQNAPQGFLNKVAQSLRGVTPSPLPADLSSTPQEEVAPPSGAGEEDKKKEKPTPTSRLDGVEKYNIYCLNWQYEIIIMVNLIRVFKKFSKSTLLRI